MALLLGLFLIHLALTTVTELSARQAEASRRLDALTAARVTRTVLRGELDRGRPDDWIVRDDSLRLRAFRGTAIVCQVDSSAAALTVGYRGDRLPEPTKDSVELIGGDGSVVRLALDGSTSTSQPCPLAEPGEEVLRWLLSGPPPAEVVVARLFESGSYHLAGSALRYRRGAGGRQPLTPEVWRDPATGFASADSSAFMTLTSTVPQGTVDDEFLVWLRR